MDVQDPVVSFCISTFKRPVLLAKQLALICRQQFSHFHIVVSDNDPDASARETCASIGDDRIKYYHNEVNLGMIRSFNRSIDRATSKYVVLITDDDPVTEDFLSEVVPVAESYPGHSLYGGFLRAHRKPGELETIEPGNFIAEILDTDKTPSILWSSCILLREAVIDIGKIPDYGSPHLADHALLALTGSKGGGVIVNKMFSSLTQHDSNFSKFNFDYYTKGCDGFYHTLVDSPVHKANAAERAVVDKHLGSWFITSIFNLKKYYTVNKNPGEVAKVTQCAEEIMAFPHMKKHVAAYRIKNLIFQVKKSLHLLQ